MMRIASEFGFTPASRSRIATPSSHEPSLFDRLEYPDADREASQDPMVRPPHHYQPTGRDHDAHRFRVRLHASHPEQNCGAGKRQRHPFPTCWKVRPDDVRLLGTAAVKCSLRGLPVVCRLLGRLRLRTHPLAPAQASEKRQCTNRGGWGTDRAAGYGDLAVVREVEGLIGAVGYTCERCGDGHLMRFGGQD